MPVLRSQIAIDSFKRVNPKLSSGIDRSASMLAERDEGVDAAPVDAELLRVLIIDDSEDDAFLVLRELRRGGFQIASERVVDAATLRAALAHKSWHIIICDYALPRLNALAALRLVQHLALDVPFLVVSGRVGEDAAAEVMRAGAQDFLLKDELSRLTPAVHRELRETRMRRQSRAASQQARDANAQVHALSTRMLEIQEAERRLIATELHDDIGQALTALKFHIDAARRKLGTPNLPAMLDEAARIAEQTLTKLRDISLALRPAQLDDLGLVATLRWHADRQATATGTDIKFFADAGLGRLDSGLETACFRVAQEALTNIAKHAKANQVSIELIVEGDALLLAIRDDGVGFDTEAALRLAASGASLGLVSMRERATLAGGELSIESASGHGTHIQARFPLRPLI